MPARELRHVVVDGVLERREARFSAVEARLCSASGREADFCQAGRLIAKLIDRFLMDLPQRAPLVLDDARELVQPPLRILFEAGVEGVPAAHPRLQLTDHVCLAFAKGAPRVEDYADTVE